MDAHDHIESAIDAVARAQKAIKKGKTKQVRSQDERDHMKTVATLWFGKIQPTLCPVAPSDAITPVDQALRIVFDSTARDATRNTYVRALGDAKKALIALRAALPAVAPLQTTNQQDDAPPSFSPLAVDPRMQLIMERRWAECVFCLDAKAYLAAVVMMGGLLESLFVSRANRLTDKTPLINATRAPQRKGKTVPLQDWTLNAYIEVGHELDWIGQTAKDVGMVLRDYRNFIHPQQEYAQQVVLAEHDARLMWDVTKSLIRQLLNS